MDLSVVDTQLKDILNNLENSQTLIKLQRLLNSKNHIVTLLDQSSTRVLLKTICKKLQKFLLQTSLYHLILTLDSKEKADILEICKCRSLHDLRGNFLWFDEKCKRLFKNNHLEECSIFNMMDPQSIYSISKKYGRNLLKSRKPRIIKYLLNDGMTVLTSRCSIVLKNKGTKSPDIVILVETRPAKKELIKDVKPHFKINNFGSLQNSPMFSYKSDLCAFSPFNPHQFSQLEKMYPHSKLKKNIEDLDFSFNDTPMENLKLSPFLVCDLPLKTESTPSVKDFRI